jgi:hypothetical protein
MYAEHNFEGIAIGNESWFQYSSYSNSMFAGSRESVVPKIQRDISGQKTILAIFFILRRLLVLETLPKGKKFNHIILLTRYCQDCTMKRGELHAKRASQLFQFTWLIRCVILVARSPRTCQEKH